MIREEKNDVISYVDKRMAKLKYEISQGDLIGIEMCLRDMLKSVSAFSEKATPEELGQGN